MKQTKKRPFLIGLGVVALLSPLLQAAFSPNANATIYSSTSKRGAPQFTFQPSVPATPGDVQEIILSKFYRNVRATTLDACGYKSASPGTKATGIESLTIGSTVTAFSALPQFVGRCVSGVLTPTVAGEAVPTSHYANDKGSVFARVSIGDVFQIAVTDQKRNVRADNCGNFKLNWPNARDGEPSFGWDATTTVSGQTYNLENGVQSASEGICSNRWTWGNALIPERISRFFVAAM